MTYYNPPPDPFKPAASAYGPPRPTGVTVLAITGIVEGILGLLCGGFGVIANAASLMAGHNVFIASANLPREMMIVNAVFAIFMLILAIVLLAGSIGALSLRSWARQLLMSWSIAAIVVFVVQFLIQWLWIGPRTAEAIKAIQPSNPMASMPWVATCFGVVILVVYCALPICFLMLWSSDQVKAAFALPPGYPK